MRDTDTESDQHRMEMPRMSAEGKAEAEDKKRLHRAEIRGKLTVIALVLVLIAVMDYISFRWFVPWADEMTTNNLMSLGYIVAFFVVFCNFIILFALMAYLFQTESYVSDEWQ